MNQNPCPIDGMSIEVPKVVCLRRTINFAALKTWTKAHVECTFCSLVSRAVQHYPKGFKGGYLPKPAQYHLQDRRRLAKRKSPINCMSVNTSCAEGSVT